LAFNLLGQIIIFIFNGLVFFILKSYHLSAQDLQLVDDRLEVLGLIEVFDCYSLQLLLVITVDLLLDRLVKLMRLY
jgi:hypothetical protein